MFEKASILVVQLLGYNEDFTNALYTAFDNCYRGLTQCHVLDVLKQVFEGSWDRDTPVTHVFYTSVEAQYVRILPQEWHTHISIRFELLGCRSKLKQLSCICFAYKSFTSFNVRLAMTRN